VLRLQRFYNKPLEKISEEQLRQYWLTCKNEFGWSAATLRISYSGIKQFFKRTLVRDWKLLGEVKFIREESLPTILSTSEVKRIIDNLTPFHNKAFYLVLYSLGLRLREATHLKVSDILTERGLVHVHSGKGARDRVVPLPRITLQTLREYYLTHRNPTWLFPTLGHDNGKSAESANRPMRGGSVQSALQRTAKKLGFKKHIHPHVFRHAYATHLLEANVPIRHVQKILGHKTLKSTMVYLHVTTQAQTDSNDRVSRIMHGVLS
jgi:site-specific recombinase XerD